MATCNELEPKSKKTGDKPEDIDDDDDPDLCIPPSIRRRVNALRKLQLESLNIEKEFCQKVHELECEYAGQLAPLNDKRRQIVNGLYEPNENDCEIPVPFEEKFLADELQKQAAIKNDLPESEKNMDDKGIDEFWLTVFRNSNSLASMVQYHDEPALKHLIDVEVKITKDPMTFTLFFHFSPNEYFTNTILTKEYVMKCEPEADDPFSFEGPEVVSCKGCTIEWKEGKNITKKVVTKKQKHKQKGSTRIVSKEVKVESFFDFFNPPNLPDGGELTPESHELLSADFDIGQLLRERVIPHAALYYTGETNDGDDEDEYGDGEEDLEDFDDLEDDDSEDDGEGGDPRKR